MPEQEGRGPAASDTEFSESQRITPEGVQERETAPAPELLLLPEIRTYAPGERLELMGDNGALEKHLVIASNEEAEEVFLQRMNSQDKLRLEVFTPLELGLELQSQPLAIRAQEILNQVVKERAEIKGLNTKVEELVEGKQGSLARSAALEVFYNRDVPKAKQAEAVRAVLERYLDGLSAKRQLHEVKKAEAYARHVEDLADIHYPEPDHHSQFDQAEFVEHTVKLLKEYGPIDHEVTELRTIINTALRPGFYEPLDELLDTTTPYETDESEEATEPGAIAAGKLAKLRALDQRRRAKPTQAKELTGPSAAQRAREKAHEAWRTLGQMARSADRLLLMTDPTPAKARDIYETLQRAFQEANQAALEAQITQARYSDSQEEYERWLAVLGKLEQRPDVAAVKKMQQVKKARPVEIASAPMPDSEPSEPAAKPEPKTKAPGTWLGHWIDSFVEKTENLLLGKK